MIYAFSIYATDTHDLHLEGYFVADGVRGIAAVHAANGISIDDRELFNICLKIFNREEVDKELHYVVQEITSKQLLTYKKNVALKEAGFFEKALEDLSK